MAKLLSELPIGAKVKDLDTRYYGEPIVFTVMEHGHAGDPANSTALITTNIIKIAGFDGKESNNSNNFRKNYGNNRYLYSNLLQWLNSNENSNWYTAKHSADAPPTKANMNNYNGYDTEAGFLTNFSKGFKEGLLNVTKTTAKNTATDGGGTETVTSKIFLLSAKEVGITNSGLSEGSMYARFNVISNRIAYPTAEAVANSDYTNISASSPWYWWLRTPRVDTEYMETHVSGNLETTDANKGNNGVRPALCISSSTKVSDNPDSDGAYVLSFGPMPLVEKSLGSLVKIKVDGTPREFMVVDKSLDGGVKLLLKTPFSTSKYSADNNNDVYFDKELDIACNQTFYNQIEDGVKNKILPSSVLHVSYNNVSTTKNRYVYAPSFTEYGFGTDSTARVEGRAFQYFEDIGNKNANTKRSWQQGTQPSTIYDHGWLRSCQTGSGARSSVVFDCYYNGSSLTDNANAEYGVRPALTLPYNLIVDEDGNVTTQEAKLTLGDMPLGSSVKIGVNGSNYDFTVVNKDTNDITLWSKESIDIVQQQSFGTTSTYNGSSIDNYVNNHIYSLIESGVRNRILNKAINSNGKAISRKVYLPSVTELGGTHQYALTTEGPVWQYFSDTGGGIGSNSKRAFMGNMLPGYSFAWLRSLYTVSASTVWGLGGMNSNSKGAMRYYTSDTKQSIVPALDLPPDATITSDGKVTFNSAPSTPATINVPSTIYGGKNTTVSWSASTDPDGNLEGYELERSTDGGSTWSNRYRGELTQTTGQVPYGVDSVMYRVRAYDTDGAYSSWRTSQSVDVINNVPPTMPEISVPGSVYAGRQCVINWTESTDPEGDDFDYVLEKSENSGDWEEVYRGEDLTYTDTVSRGIDTIRWKVYAEDVHGDKSEESITPIRTVIHNNPPEITSDPEDGTDLGDITEPFSITYSVEDEDGDTITVSENIDERVIREQQIELGEEYTFEISDLEFLKTLNGEHTATINARDRAGVVTNTIKFTKALYKATAELLEPMVSDEPIEVCAINVVAEIPDDAIYKVEVTNNALDDSPVWEDMTAQVKAGLNHAFSNQTLQREPAFNIRASVERGPSGQGGYIDAIQGVFQ